MKLADLKLCLEAVNLLRQLKKRMKLRELSRVFGIPIPTLSRYVNGKVLPRKGKAARILELASDLLRIKEEVMRKIEKKKDVVSHLALLSDVFLLEKVAKHAASIFSKNPPTKVLTASADGIPLATLIARELGAELIYMKERMEPGARGYYKVKVGKISYSFTFYLPLEWLSKKDSVLIVDDMMRGGGIIKAMLEIVRQAKAKLIGIYVMLAVEKRRFEKLKEKYNAHAFSVLG